MENVKKFIKPGFYITVGFLNFIWLMLNHISQFYRYRGDRDSFKLCRGFEFFGWKSVIEHGNVFKLLAFFSIVCIILISLALLFIGVIKLLESLEVNVSSISRGGFLESAASIALLINLCACSCDFLFVTLLGLLNTDTYGTGWIIGLRAGIGCWILMISSVVAFFVFKFVIQKATKTPAESTASNGTDYVSQNSGYVCTVCGKVADADFKFCPYCGGAVAEVVPEVPAQPTCPVCGKAVDADFMFCPYCGGAVAEVVPKAPAQPTCPVCGKAVDADAKFCQSCGHAFKDSSEGAQHNNPNTGFVDINWQQYAPINAGVTFDHNRDYKFHRAEGFVGSLPQNYVDRTYPKCPLCRSTAPDWNIGQHNQMSWKGNLYMFKCSCCNGVISMSMPDVTTLGNGKHGVGLNPSVGLANLVAKSSSGKEAGAVYAVIESVGTSGVTRECEGKEFKVEQIQKMAERT